MAAKNRSWKVTGFYSATRFKCYPEVKKCSRSDNKNRNSLVSRLYFIYLHMQSFVQAIYNLFF